MTRQVDDLAPQLRSLLTLGCTSGLTDAQLLGRFATGEGEAASLAFEVLVERHGPMVLRVCRGILRNPHDAQDAFQATFLILVRKANSIRDRDSVASWLHGVALRVAHHSRMADARRRRLERREGERANDLRREVAGDDLDRTLHEEVGRLPERYRAAVVLCYLEGHTCDDAARILRWPVGTVKSRLARAKERLRVRLVRSGHAPSFALKGPKDIKAVAPLSPHLVKVTAETAGRFWARSLATPAARDAVALAEGVLKVMPLAKLKLTISALLAAVTWLGISSAMMVGTSGQIPTETTAPSNNPGSVGSAPGREPRVDEDLKVEEARKSQSLDPIGLMIPRHLSAEGGSGTVLMYALDPNGQRILDNQAAKGIEAPGARGKGFADRNPIAAVWKEVDVPLHWVAITAILDNQAIREAEARIRNIELSEAYPQYRRVEIQRQFRFPEGNWSDWEDLDYARNYRVLDNIPESSPERMPEEFRPLSLVDPLPFLKEGAWNGVDPKALLDLPAPGQDRAAIQGRQFLSSPALAIRSLDFTVAPGMTYRYRVRVVVANPDFVAPPPPAQRARDRALAGPPQINSDKRMLFGPWSEATREVIVP